MFCGWFGEQIAHLCVLRDATQVKGRKSAREHARDVVNNACVFHQDHAVLTWKNVASATPRWPITAKYTSALEAAYNISSLAGYIDKSAISINFNNKSL